MPCTAARAGGTGSTVYAFGTENFIAQQGSGWRWYDRAGNSIDYDESGRILAYTNPAGIKVSFEYTAGHLSRVLDHHGQPALSIQTDAQGRVTQVSDATPGGGGRSVQYTWSGTGTLPNNSEISYGIYLWMAPQQIQTPRVTKNQTFDALQRPTSIEVKNKPDSGTAQLLMSRLYQYDQRLKRKSDRNRNQLSLSAHGSSGNAAGDND